MQLGQQWSSPLFRTGSRSAEVTAVLADAMKHGAAVLGANRRSDALQNGYQPRSGSSYLPSVCHPMTAGCQPKPRNPHNDLSPIFNRNPIPGVQTKATIKQAKPDQFVEKTLDRSLLWEMHTPQARRDVGGDMP